MLTYADSKQWHDFETGMYVKACHFVAIFVMFLEVVAKIRMKWIMTSQMADYSCVKVISLWASKDLFMRTS